MAGSQHFVNRIDRIMEELVALRRELTMKDSQPARSQHAGHPETADLLNQEEVCRKFGISDQTWSRWRKAGRTPEAITLPGGRLKWRREDIDAMAGKVAPRVSRYFRSVRGER